MQRSANRNGKRRRSRIRPQTQIDTEDVTIAGAVLQDAHQPPRQPRKRIDTFIGIADSRLGFINENNQIYIGRIVELARAELAHAKNDPATILFRIAAIRQIDPASRVGIEQ